MDSFEDSEADIITTPPPPLCNLTEIEVERMDVEEVGREPSRPYSRCTKFIAVSVFVAIIIVALVLTDTKKHYTEFIEWVNDHKIEGALAFVALFSTSEVFFFPGSVLALGAGVAFGLYIGVLVVWIGAVIGQSLAFVIGRYLLRESVTRWLENHEKWAIVDKAIQKDGWKMVVLLRLAPYIPYNLLNYALSLTAIEFHEYFVVSAVAIIPGVCLYVYLGSLAKDIGEAVSKDSNDSVTYVAISASVSGAIVLLVVVLTVRYARRALRRELHESKPPEEQEDGLAIAGSDASETGISTISLVPLMTNSGNFIDESEIVSPV
uniref:VTT domain-containing protein n=1 Tax=Pyramimonas obovata TaxID=1411642 RepID=A0A7S0MSD9_9CHLO|mmetsp:Transcript_11455/g.23950  ORF Transcript_11455/g.23950 Transcript_11455/m.23950 type:complete len:321 (+) Transcript_11455:232-1194(+)|eukprot:CAMPEP_0118942728 /NCGR_PEP_ID=MMETSP1169-20130426/36738_1 /TAXON_ID=36882 /ORGANISM="Pyramimonas obovata, Strain CCMP722" /LENGTH=320 /DNA_ID=CAMNT_0006887793 /DNA_START=161 /DNA_END=1123 /DNA_ORIENTATION=+